MVIDTSKLNSTSWKTTLGGLVTGGLLFLSSYIQNGHTFINIHDPKFWMSFALAAWGYVMKDKNVTGGTVANNSNNPAVVATTAVSKL